MTKDEAKELLRWLIGAYGKKWEQAESSTVFWVISLERLDHALTREVILEWTNSEPWPPSWADINERVKMKNPDRLLNAKSWKEFLEIRDQLRSQLTDEQKLRLGNECGASVAVRSEAEEKLGTTEPEDRRSDVDKIVKGVLIKLPPAD